MRNKDQYFATYRPAYDTRSTVFEMDANNLEHTSSENRKIKIHDSNSTCCVPRCIKSSYSFEENEERVSFHSFPKGDTAKIWRIKMHRNAAKHYVTKYTKICWRHFKEKDFQTSPKGKRALKQKSIPSIFPWTKHHSNIKIRPLLNQAKTTEMNIKWEISLLFQNLQIKTL